MGSKRRSCRHRDGPLSRWVSLDELIVVQTCPSSTLYTPHKFRSSLWPSVEIQCARQELDRHTIFIVALSFVLLRQQCRSRQFAFSARRWLPRHLLLLWLYNGRIFHHGLTAPSSCFAGTDTCFLHSSRQKSGLVFVFVRTAHFSFLLFFVGGTSPHVIGRSSSR